MKVWEELKKLDRIVAVKKGSILFGLLVFFLFSSLVAVTPYLIGQAIDVLNRGGDYHTFLLLIGVTVGAYLLKCVVSLAMNRLLISINVNFAHELRCKLMEKIVSLPMDYLRKNEKGYLLSRMEECSELESLFSSDSISTVCQIVIAMFALIVMFLLHWKLALISLVFLPVVFFITKNNEKHIARDIEATLEKNGILSGEGYEILNGVEDFKVLNRREEGFSSFVDKSADLALSRIKMKRRFVCYDEFINLLCNLESVFVLLLCGALILQGQVTIGLYTAFAMYLSYVTSGILCLGNLRIALEQPFRSMERINALFSRDSENEKGREVSEKISNISFENVSFSYDEHEVLTGCSFALHSGDRVLLRGKNGSGKSTVVKLMLGLYAPVSGRIFYNNADAKELAVKSIREHIAVVSQHIFLFKGSVLDNLFIGLHGKTRADVQKILAELDLTAYFETFPQGLDTDIQQHLSGVSGGQMQMIAIVRAILSGKEVVIMDEPFSNLDESTRDLLTKILERWHYSDILVVVSHEDPSAMGFTKEICLD